MGPGSQWEWAEDFDMSAYAGKVHTDGVQALIDCVRNCFESGNKVTLICIAPLTNIHSAIEKAPDIVTKVDKVVAMAGVKEIFRELPTYFISRNFQEKKRRVQHCVRCSGCPSFFLGILAVPDNCPTRRD